MLAEESGIGERGASALIVLKPKLEQMLERSGMTELYRNVELPLEHVLFDMESAGFMLDREVLCSLGETMAARSEELAKEIHELAGESFNILSRSSFPWYCLKNSAFRRERKQNGIFDRQ